MSISFSYGLREGRLSCELAVDGSSVVHAVAGWHDGLRELVVAACEMLGRAHEATASFQEEPGEFRWRISRLTENRIRVRIIEFGDWATGQPDAAGKLLFDRPCGAVAFARAVFEGSSEQPSTPEWVRLGELLKQYDFSA
jgi:hypothetical protein